MTIIGKILTFLVFFLSIVFLGFAYNINQLNKDPKTGKSWYQLATDLRREVGDAKSDLNAKDEEAKAKVRKAEGEREVALTARGNAEKETEKAQKDREEAITAAQKAKTDFENSQVALKAAQDEVEKRRQENVALYQNIKQKELAINDLQAKAINSDNTKVQAQVAAATYLARLQTMERQLQDTTRELEKFMEEGNVRVAKAGGSDVQIAAQNPPPDDVKGTVTSVTPDGLVAISIGSDAGLLKGHTLEVFRSKPKPFYLGQIKIVEVGPHEAVGKVVYPQYKKLIQANDEVASHIVPR
jgi:hypothetical protein